MRPKICMSSIVPSPAREQIAEQCDIEFYEGDAPSTFEGIMSRIGGKDGLVCLVGDRISKEIMEAAGPTLKVISTASVGFEHIDAAEATRRGIYVGYTPGVLTEATADLAFALLLGAARRLAEADRYVRTGQWKVAWSPTAFLGASVYGRSIGIIGMGRIGKAMARRAKGFGMLLLYTDRVRLTPPEEADLGLEFRSLEGLLADADFVSIHAPSTKETYHLMNEDRLRLMRPGAVLINTSRGPLVDEAALALVLSEGRIGGAGLDVYEKEPIEGGSPLLGLDNVTLAPHIGSATRESREKMGEAAAINLLNVLRGKPPAYWLNPEVERVRGLCTVKMI
jgi:glyoxylate reductase